MNAHETLRAILHAIDKGEDPALILDENSPLMDAAREAVKAPSQAGSCQASVEDEALLPCPFCGSDQVSASVGESGGEPWHYIECEECAASAEPDVWNRRAPPAGRTLTDAMPWSAEEAISDASGLIGWQLRLGDQAVQIWKDQEILPGFRAGSGFVPSLGEVISYRPLAIVRKLPMMSRDGGKDIQL